MEKKINGILSAIMLGNPKNRNKRASTDYEEPDFMPIDIAKIKPFEVS